MCHPLCGTVGTIDTQTLYLPGHISAAPITPATATLIGRSKRCLHLQRGCCLPRCVEAVQINVTVYFIDRVLSGTSPENVRSGSELPGLRLLQHRGR